MKALIFAAGLGTRLKPWTLHHPKALVPVGGVPMLERVIVKLKSQGFDDFVINVHHFSEQIVSFLKHKDFGVRIRVSDESDMLLDTGGGLLKAADMLFDTAEPVLIHNADILSDANLHELMEEHRGNATLLVSPRHSSRKLICDPSMRMCGWHNLNTGELRPEGIKISSDMKEWAFSGIHVVSPSVIEIMKKNNYSGKFSIMDFYINECETTQFFLHNSPSLNLIDIGKPETLAKANELF